MRRYLAPVSLVLLIGAVASLTGCHGGDSEGPVKSDKTPAGAAASSPATTANKGGGGGNAPRTLPATAQ